MSENTAPATTEDLHDRLREAESAIERVRGACANPLMQGPNATLVVPVADVLAALNKPTNT